MKDIICELQWRGLIHQTTDDENLPQWLAAQSRTLYAGFDPTADSLHVGSLMPLLYLRRFQQAGHRPIALVGGATGMIGDPSGKSEERNLLSVDRLRENIHGIGEQMRRLLDFDCGERSALLVNNFDWMQKFSYLDFLRDVGKSFPIGVMLGKESVKSRLQREDGGLSYTEFSYMLLQAYDFAHLSRQYDCQLQVGGSDQWGNITCGIDLARRMGPRSGKPTQLYGITCPLLTKSDGGKMGKTESGTIWLSARRTSPYQFYQYWINIDDVDAGRCLRMLTELDQQEVESLDAARAEHPQCRESQKRLALELTRLIHGPSGLESAQRATEIFFGAEIDSLDDRQLGEIFSDVSSQQLPRDRLAGEGLSVIDALCESGLAKTKGEARRTIAQGGGYINNRRIIAIDQTLTPADLASETVMVLRCGKRRYALLRFSN